MRRYSVTEAMDPAWLHTRSLLWQDRRRGRLLKICFLAIGAQLGTFSANVNGHVGGGGLPPELAPVLAVFAVMIVLIGLPIWLGTFYLGSRLDLALFDVVLLRDDRVGPAWQRHGRQTWRWMAVKAATVIVLLVLFAPLLIPASLRLVHLLTAHPVVSATQRGLQWDAAALRAALRSAVGLTGLFALLLALLQCVRNLALPGLAMEDLRFGQAFARAWLLFRSDTAAMVLFAVVQPICLVLLGLAAFLTELLIVAIAALPLAAIGALLWAALHRAGALGWLLLGLCGSLGGLVLIAVLLLASVVLMGTLHTFSRAWTLYFLGGRYALLGQYLTGEPAVPVWTPPPSIPSGIDDDDGPDLPLSPELA